MKDQIFGMQSYEKKSIIFYLLMEITIITNKLYLIQR